MIGRCPFQRCDLHSTTSWGVKIFEIFPESGNKETSNWERTNPFVWQDCGGWSRRIAHGGHCRNLSDRLESFRSVEGYGSTILLGRRRQSERFRW